MQVASLVFYQVIEQPTQRPVVISPSTQYRLKGLTNLELCHHAVLQVIEQPTQRPVIISPSTQHRLKRLTNLELCHHAVLQAISSQ